MNLVSMCVCVLVMAVALGVECAGGPVKVEAVDYSEKIIYHSPETPGYTSWAGLWQLPSGRLRCDFAQLAGPKDKPVGTVPVLESEDDGVTWKHIADHPLRVVMLNGILQSLAETGRGMAVMKDGTLIRPAQPNLFDGKQSGYIERSVDNGKTWQRVYPAPPDQYKVYPTLLHPLRDGRAVLFAGVWKVGDDSNGSGVVQNLVKTIYVSSDKGKTWGKPVVLMPASVGACEESDFCELPNGDLFFVHRAVHYGKDPLQTRMQSIVAKHGKDFIPGPPEESSLPHSGYPVIMYIKEGIILHFATDGIKWTADLGKTWTPLDIPGTAYYPKAVRVKEGKFVVVGHIGSDDQYGTVDQSIKEQTFRLKVTR
jgi:hypothetical protein